ncbi:MAG: hypothetical protein AB7H93_09870 [Vicinamibacterales bacterium]
MTDDEAGAAFDELRAVLNISHLAWVLPFLDEEIQRGKPGTRRLEKSAESVGYRIVEGVDYYAEVAKPRRGRVRKTEEFTTVTPFTAQEKLELLVTAVERVLREMPRLSKAAADQMFEDGVRLVKFVDEESDREFTLDPKLNTEEQLDQLHRLFGAVKV